MPWIRTTIVLLLASVSLSAAEKPKYALSLFHFNLQYVAGDFRIENRIIRQSFLPLMKLLDQHPNWRINLEIQGWAFEVMQENHPDALALFKKLIDRRQIELTVAHYSDQFFLAYPALDMRRSIAISDQILQDLGISRSRVFVAQEIQWSPALPSMLHGKYNVIVTSSGPHSYYRPPTPPLVRARYAGKDMLALIGGGKKDLKNLRWTWAFFDDGEVFNTTDYRSDFFRVPEQEKKNIARYQKLEAEGYRFITISEFVDILKNDPDYRIPDYPYVPEGTWNMNQGGPYMWMGRQRSGVETDGLTRAICYRTRGRVLLAERVVEYIEKLGQRIQELREWLLKAWKHLLLSEVSDSSGWTPLLIEVRYTEDEAHKADLIVDTMLQNLADALKLRQTGYIVTTRDGQLQPADHIESRRLQPETPPVPVFVRAESARITCKRIANGLWVLDIEAQRPEDGAVEIAFPTAESGLIYSPPGGEDAQIGIPTDTKRDPILALASGWIYLGDGMNLIKDTYVEHLAATWKREQQRLVFREEMNENEPVLRMRFYLLQGQPAQGRKLANALNVWPTYYLYSQNGKIKTRRLRPEDEPFGLPQ